MAQIKTVQLFSVASGLAFLVAAAMPAIATAEETLGAEVACYSALRGHSNGNDMRISQDLVLVPAKRGAKNGFYVYSRGEAHFHEIPKIQESQFRFKLKLEGRAPVYVDLRRGATPEQGQVRSGATCSQLGAQERDFTPLGAGDTLDNLSRASIHQDLQNRVQTVAEAFRQQRAATPPAAQGQLRTDFEKSLDACGMIGQIRENTMQQRQKIAASVPAAVEGPNTNWSMNGAVLGSAGAN